MIDIWDNNVADPGSRQIGAEQIGQGPTLAAAIRDAGIRCETCKHWDRETGICEWLTAKTVAWPADVITPSDFFCASYSLLTQPSEGEE